MIGIDRCHMNEAFRQGIEPVLQRQELLERGIFSSTLGLDLRVWALVTSDISKCYLKVLEAGEMEKGVNELRNFLVLVWIFFFF